MDSNVAAFVTLLVAIGATVIAAGAARRKARSRAWAFFTFWFPPTVLLLLLLPSLHVDGHAAARASASVPKESLASQISMERRKRGFFGKLVAIVFWGWQIIMAAWMISYLVDVSKQYQQGVEDAERIGTAIGGTIGISVILWIWLFGAIIFGVMMFFTRGEKVIITHISNTGD